MEMKRWVVLALVLAAPACGFDWNGRADSEHFEARRQPITIGSGHPLATARALRLAARQAATDPRLAGTFRSVLRADPAGADALADGAPLLQTVLFGSWLNEVNTALDGDTAITALGGLYLSHSYRAFLEHRRHSLPWTPDTGSSSSNPLHSMAITAKTHPVPPDRSFEAIHDHLESALAEAIGELASGDDAAWRAGLLALGSVFHTVEDSAVGATPAARARVPQCVPGDGHGVLAVTAHGLQVVALSSNAWFDHRRAMHRRLDDLYRLDADGDRERSIRALYGDFDPALANARVMIGVLEAIRAGEPAAAAAHRLVETLLWPRWAAPADRVPLPACPGR